MRPEAKKEKAGQATQGGGSSAVAPAKDRESMEEGQKGAEGCAGNAKFGALKEDREGKESSTLHRLKDKLFR
jgi:hypothetical protein